MIAWRQLHGGVDTWIHAGCRNPGSSRVPGGQRIGECTIGILTGRHWRYVFTLGHLQTGHFPINPPIVRIMICKPQTQKQQE
jgi:hypothetical protein